MPTRGDFIAAFALVGTVAAAGVGVVGYGVYSYGRHNGSFGVRNNEAVVNLSTGRQQILDQGLAGDRTDLNKFLSEKVNEYFKSRGLPCDPGEAAKIVGVTIEKAKSCPNPAP